jgi:hypothetical protein
MPEESKTPELVELVQRVISRDNGLVERQRNYFDIDEACAAAERLAEEPR